MVQLVTINLLTVFSCICYDYKTYKQKWIHSLTETQGVNDFGQSLGGVTFESITHKIKCIMEILQSWILST